MLICVKSRIAELEQEKASLPDSKELVSLKADKTEANGADSDQDSNKIKIVAKIFLNDFEESSIGESIECLLKNCSTTPTVILAYHPTAATSTDKFVWADNNAKSKENFKALWAQLQEAQAAGKIAQLGIADMDLETILDIFHDKKYDFTILQINTQTCCVVPPELQQFCKDHDIQLLTHSDPQSKRVFTLSSHIKARLNRPSRLLSEIFPKQHLDEIQLQDFKIKWTVRYLETLVCRGILTKKGFIVNLRKSSN